VVQDVEKAIKISDGYSSLQNTSINFMHIISTGSYIQADTKALF